MRSPKSREESLMKRSTNRKRYRPEVGKLSPADEALTKSVAIAEVARFLDGSEVT